MLKLWPDQAQFMSILSFGFKCDLDLLTYFKNVLNGTDSPQVEHLCQTILESMQNVEVVIETICPIMEMQQSNFESSDFY